MATATIKNTALPTPLSAPFATPTWDDWVAAMLDPINRVGSTDPLSRNFHWNLGVVGLPGRAGLNAGLSLDYNSGAVWTKTDRSYMGLTSTAVFHRPDFV